MGEPPRRGTKSAPVPSFPRRGCPSAAVFGRSRCSGPGVAGLRLKPAAIADWIALSPAVIPRGRCSSISHPAAA